MMNDDITYIGVEQEEKPENTTKTKIKSKKNKNVFKVNKRNRKVDKFISSTKNSFFTKEKIVIVLIILAIVIFKPITFLQNALDKKREYYAMINEYSSQNTDYSLNIDVNLGSLWNTIVYTTGEEYYVNCKGTLLMPVDGNVICHYDWTHRGIDIASYSYPGTVYAATSGTVCYVGYSQKYGNELMIEHNINGMTLYTYYGNLANITVSEGQSVDTNTVIGTEAGDNTSPAVSVDGNSHHVHFAVRKSYKESSGMNPLIFAKYR